MSDDQRRANYLICKEKIDTALCHLQYLEARWRDFAQTAEYQATRDGLQVLREKCWEMV